MDSTSFIVHPISEFAPQGFLIIADTSPHVAGNEATKPVGSTYWCAFHALGGDVVFSASTAGASSSLATRTLSNGDTIYGPFGSVTLTSGVLLAYWNYPSA